VRNSGDKRSGPAANLLSAPSQVPAFLREAEAAVDQHYQDVGRLLDLPWHMAAYVLASFACAALTQAFLRYMPDGAVRCHIQARHVLEGLHFALRAVPHHDKLPETTFNGQLVDNMVSASVMLRVEDVLNQLENYADIRDAFITYHRGGYSARLDTAKSIVFDDVPQWPGSRDYAENVVRPSIQLSALRGVPAAHAAQDWDVNSILSAIYLPRDIPLGDLDSGTFLSIHLGLAERLCKPHRDGVHLLERDQLLAMVGECGNATSRQAEQYLRMVEYDPSGHPALSPFHCPVLALGKTSRLVMVPCLVWANPRVAIPRLAVHRGLGFDDFSARMETYLANLLKEHYTSDVASCWSCVPYKNGPDEGDIDLALLDRQDGTLFLAQLKAFVPPDSVSEVLSANEKLQEGVEQAVRVREWLTSDGGNGLRQRLGISQDMSALRVIHAVVGNGFAGSDYLHVPRDIVMLSVDFLLQPEYLGGCLRRAIDDYEQRIREAMSGYVGDAQYDSVDFGGWSFRMRGGLLA